MLAIVFFWLVGHARLQRYTLAFVPLDRRGGVRNAWNEVEGRLGRWFRGQLILMAHDRHHVRRSRTSSSGVPSALLLGLIAALCEAIPLVGPIIGAVPAVLAAATVSPELALLVIAVTAVSQVGDVRAGDHDEGVSCLSWKAASRRRLVAVRCAAGQALVCESGAREPAGQVPCVRHLPAYGGRANRCTSSARRRGAGTQDLRA